MRNLGDFDALHDARRNRRLGQNRIWDACKERLEETKGIDKDYQALVIFLLNTPDSEMHETRKRGREDVNDVDEEDSDEFDPEYEHFFGKLEKFGKSYLLENVINSKPVFVKYEGVGTLKDESEPVSGSNTRNIKPIYRLPNQKPGLENDLAEKTQKASGLQAQLGKKGCSRRACSLQSPRRIVNPIKKENVINLVTEPLNKKPDHKNNQLAQNLQGYSVQSRSSVGILVKNPGLRNNLVTKRMYQHDSQAGSSKKDDEPIHFQKVFPTRDGIKGKNVLPDLAEKDKLERHIFFREVSRPGSVVKGTKTGYGNNYLAKNKLEDDVQARLDIEGFSIKSEKAEVAECSKFYKGNGDENSQKNKSEDERSLDVVILDSAEFFKANNLSPFVASKKIHENMGMGDDLQHLGNPSMYSDFRKQILDVLGKPFDKDEYKKLQEMVGIPNTQGLNENIDRGSGGSCSRNKKKSFLDYHSDVKRKLSANRYNRQKRLNILRGFVFWLENLTKQGAFKPWLDRDCLAVEPKSRNKERSNHG